MDVSTCGTTILVAQCRGRQEAAAQTGVASFHNAISQGQSCPLSARPLTTAPRRSPRHTHARVVVVVVAAAADADDEDEDDDDDDENDEDAQQQSRPVRRGGHLHTAQ
jgi:hypothetical protein